MNGIVIIVFSGIVSGVLTYLLLMKLKEEIENE